MTVSRRDNVTAKPETQSFALLAREEESQLSEVVLARPRSLHEVDRLFWTGWTWTLRGTSSRMEDWNVLDMQRASSQLCHILTQTLTSQVTDVTEAEMGKGVIRASHHLETVADSRSQEDPEPKIGTAARRVQTEESRLV